MTTSTPSAVLNLALDVRSPGLARAFLREDSRCADLDPGVVNRAELLISELVTNAVRHGGPPITLAIACDPHSAVQVRVTDGSMTPPRARQARPQDESGRGLELMDLLSDAWGVEVSPSGKAVWFRVTP